MLDEPIESGLADACFVIPLVVAEAPYLAIAHDHFRISAPPPSPIGACTGRELRCLIASLLC